MSSIRVPNELPHAKIHLFIYLLHIYGALLAKLGAVRHERRNVSLNAHMAGLFDHQDAQTWSIERMGEGYHVAVRGSED